MGLGNTYVIPGVAGTSIRIEVRGGMAVTKPPSKDSNNNSGS